MICEHMVDFFLCWFFAIEIDYNYDEFNILQPCTFLCCTLCSRQINVSELHLAKMIFGWLQINGFFLFNWEHWRAQEEGGSNWSAIRKTFKSPITWFPKRVQETPELLLLLRFSNMSSVNDLFSSPKLLPLKAVVRTRRR